MKRIYQNDYSNWSEYYYQYQYTLAKEYYIPYLIKNNVILNNISIIDVGCGNGGFISAFTDSSNKTGIEIKEFPWKASKNTIFQVHNILTQNNSKFIKKYDLVIIRDVIEHIDLEHKQIFMDTIKSFLNKNGKILVTFPPYFSPFGLHQQSLMKSFLKKIPFLSLLPFSFIRILCHLLENKETLKELEEINRSRMTIKNFDLIIKDLDLKIYNKEYFLVRPSHEIRYGFKMKKAWFSNIPLMREIFVLGTSYILEKK